jgi:hypothetical protein
MSQYFTALCAKEQRLRDVFSPSGGKFNESSGLWFNYCTQSLKISLAKKLSDALLIGMMLS